MGSSPGSNTMNILRKNIYFLSKSKTFPRKFKGLFRILGFLRKKLVFLRRNFFHSIGPGSSDYGRRLTIERSWI